MPAGALDDPGRDRPAALQGGRVVEVGGEGGQVVGGVVDGVAWCGIQPGVGCLAADLPSDFGGVPLEDPDRLLVHPLLQGGGVAVRVQARGGAPEVLQDVHKVADDRDLTPRFFASYCPEGVLVSRAVALASRELDDA